MRNKFDDLQCFVISNKCDMLLLVETWLDEQEVNMYELKGYKALHSCRKKRGGGAAIYIKNTIKISELDKTDPQEDISGLSAVVGDNNLKVSLIYRPPSYDYDQCNLYLETLMGKYPKKHLIIGDFNVNLLDKHQNQVIEYKNTIVLNGYQILNRIDEQNATRVTLNSKSVIDHVITDLGNVNNCKVTVHSNAISDHNKLEIVVEEPKKIHKPKVKYETKAINHTKFVQIFRDRIGTIGVQTFQDLINFIADCKSECEYLKTIVCRENNMWVTNELLEMIKNRDKLYKKKCEDPENIQLINEFKNIKNKVNNKIKALKNKYFREKWEETGQDSRKQWRFMNELVKPKLKENTIEALLVDNIEVTNPTDILNELNKHFTTIGKSIVNELNCDIENIPLHLKANINFEEIHCDNSIYTNPTSTIEINNVILDLKQNSSPGHDGVSVKDVLNLKEELVPILTDLTNNVLSTGVFPQELRLNKVTPIYKSGKKNIMGNYRPISIVSVFSKIVEKIIKKRILDFVDRFVGMDAFQYGFTEKSSTLSTTLDLINTVMTELDNNKIVVSVFIDLRKAFDVVSCDILLDKLYKMGIRGNMHSLIKSYLLGGQQYIKLNQLMSDKRKNEYGVPQGSVLGPLFYSLYVLSLRKAGLKARYYTFADDTALVYSAKDEHELETLVNADLKKYTNWLLCNKLKINTDKTKCMVFKQKNKIIYSPQIKIDGYTIEHVNEIKYLGLIIDNGLNWKEHITHIKNKIAPMISSVYRHRSYLSDKSKMNIYNAFFVPHLRYLLPVWGVCGKINFGKIQVTQNQVLKAIFNYDRLTHTALLYEELGVCQLSCLLKLEQSKIVYKIINKNQKSNTTIQFNSDIHTHFTRQYDDIAQTTIRTNMGLLNPMYQAAQQYNGLPTEIKQIGQEKTFIKRLKMYLKIK